MQNKEKTLFIQIIIAAKTCIYKCNIQFSLNNHIGPFLGCKPIDPI